MRTTPVNVVFKRSSQRKGLLYSAHSKSIPASPSYDSVGAILASHGNLYYSIGHPRHYLQRVPLLEHFRVSRKGDIAVPPRSWLDVVDIKSCAWRKMDRDDCIESPVNFRLDRSNNAQYWTVHCSFAFYFENKTNLPLEFSHSYNGKIRWWRLYPGKRLPFSRLSTQDNSHLKDLTKIERLLSQHGALIVGADNEIWIRVFGFSAEADE